MEEDLKSLTELVKEVMESNGVGYCSIALVNGNVSVTTQNIGSEKLDGHFLSKDGKFSNI